MLSLQHLPNKMLLCYIFKSHLNRNAMFILYREYVISLNASLNSSLATVVELKHEERMRMHRWKKKNCHLNKVFKQRFLRKTLSAT